MSIKSSDLFEYSFSTRLGQLYIRFNDFELLEVSWKKKSGYKSITKIDQFQILTSTIIQLNEYFLGKRKKFKLKLKLNGTPFQQKVYKELQKIPFGQTISYQKLAQRIGHPKAYRAVGTANSKNPFLILIPCHRVIKKDLKTGGYMGGTNIKQKLIELELNHSIRKNINDHT